MMRRALIAAALFAVLALIGLAAREALQRPPELLQFDGSPAWHDRLWIAGGTNSSTIEVWTAMHVVHDQDHDGIPDLVVSVTGAQSQTLVYSGRTGRELMRIENGGDRQTWVSDGCLLEGVDRHGVGTCRSPETCISEEQAWAAPLDGGTRVEVGGRRYRLSFPGGRSHELIVRDGESDEILFVDRLAADREKGRPSGVWGFRLQGPGWMERGWIGYWNPGDMFRLVQFHPACELIEHALPQRLSLAYGDLAGEFFLEEKDGLPVLYGDDTDEDAGTCELVRVLVDEDGSYQLDPVAGTKSKAATGVPRRSPRLRRVNGELIGFRLRVGSEVTIESLRPSWDHPARAGVPLAEYPVNVGVIERFWTLSDQDSDEVPDYFVVMRGRNAMSWLVVSGATGAILPRPEGVE